MPVMCILVQTGAVIQHITMVFSLGILFITLPDSDS